ncbi:GNAT family N-acetyltransferase [Balneolaceae bacterium ANBcel3]|nr:GNAT family N-acetyltransferase [Balneolaceae bacterium ANBcel3]
MIVEKFDHSNEKVWDRFINESKNSTFLFNRSYMDYHSDRFRDYSTMILDEKSNLIACFPANQKNDKEIISHEGLTYGGIIVKHDLKLSVFIDVYREILKYYSKQGFETLTVKAFPRIYNRIPADEFEYCAFLSEAILTRRDAAIVVDLQNRIKYSGNYRREAKKAKKNGFIIYESDNLSHFWQEVLKPNLRKRFDVEPVHTMDEIILLKTRYPDKIRLFVAESPQGTIVSGTVLFVTSNVVHCQYIGSDNEGRNSGALNYLFIDLLDNHFQDKRYFDFGIVNENQGRDINFGMLAWKERMGGRTISHDFYEIRTGTYENFDKFIK